MFKISRSTVITSVVLLLVAGASLLSPALFMAATPDGRVGWVATLWLLYFVCGLAVGIRLHRWCFVAVGVAWLPLLLLPEFISSIERPGTTTARLMFVLSPVAPLLGALLASQLSQRWSTINAASTVVAYEWSCQVCEAANPPGTTACIRCRAPTVISSQETERRRRARSLREDYAWSRHDNAPIPPKANSEESLP